MASIQILVDAALNIWEDDLIRAKLAVTQAVHESNWIKGPSLLASKYNNLFGIKGSGTGGSVNLMTTEYEKGEYIRVRQPFAVNLSLSDSFQQHKNLIMKPRYVSVRGSRTLGQAFQAVWKSGYATDPKYPQKLIDVYDTYIDKFFQE